MATVAAAMRSSRTQPGIVWGKISLHFVLIIGAIFMIMPFVAMVSTSLKTQKEFLTEFPPKLIPATFAISNYTTAMTALPFDRFYINSLIVAASVTILDSFISSLAAFAFARLRFKGRNFLFFTYLIGLMIPAQVLLLP